MQYLILYTEQGIKKSFYTNWFIPENHLNTEYDMVVFDLVNHKYMVSLDEWLDIEEDHL